MRFKRLVLKNFLTYKELDYTFPNNPVRVQGLNLTDDNQKSNGSGKSAMQTAIEFACTATNSRGVRDAELVNYDYKEAEIDLYIECGVRKETLLIQWTIKKVGSNLLQLSIQKFGLDQFNPVTFSNVNDGKKWISDWLKIEKEDLFNYYLINKERFKSFFKSSDRENIELINRFSDASIIEGIEKIDSSQKESELKELEDSLIANKTKIESKKELIWEEEIRDLEAEKQERLDLLDEEIEIRKEGIKKCEKMIQEAVNKVEALNEDLVTTNSAFQKTQKQLESFKTTNFEEKRFEYEVGIKKVEPLIKTTTLQKAEKNKQISQMTQIISDLEKSLHSSITCPQCSYKFSLREEDFDYDSVVEKKTKVEALKKKTESEFNQLQESISELDKEIEVIEVQMRAINKEEKEEEETLRSYRTALNKVKDLVDKLLRDIRLQNESMDENRQEITDLEASIKRLQEEKAVFEVDSNLQKIEGYKQDLTDLEEERGRIASKILEVGDQIYEMNQWKTNFKRFKMYIANKSLGVIEHHCNRYLNEMRTDIRLKIEGFKELASGEIRESISTTVIRGGERTFNSLSTGEKGRVLFASILANKYMLDTTHPYGGLDFLSIDEIFEGLDEVGLKYLMKSIKDFEFPIMIITHVSDEDTRTGEVLTIVKENGESRIK